MRVIFFILFFSMLMGCVPKNNSKWRIEKVACDDGFSTPVGANHPTLLTSSQRIEWWIGRDRFTKMVSDKSTCWETWKVDGE